MAFKQPKWVRIHFTNKAGEDTGGYIMKTPRFKEDDDYYAWVSAVDGVQEFTEGFTSMSNADSKIAPNSGRTKSYMSFDTYKDLIEAEKSFDGGSTAEMFKLAHKSGNPLKVSYLYNDPNPDDIVYKDDSQIAIKRGKKNESSKN